MKFLKSVYRDDGVIMSENIPLFKINSDDRDVEAVTRVIRRGSYWAQGPEIQEFEGKVAEYIGRKHAVAFNSGTSAQFADLLAYQIEGKDVIVPSFTFISTVNTIILAGGNPVFADIEMETMGLDVEDVRKRLTHDTCAIVLVHFAGSPARDTRSLRDLALEKGIALIEDAAESFGASLDEEMIGTFGDSAMFSFCQNKVITTGEGGMILTDDDSHAKKLKLVRSHGREESRGDEYYSSTRAARYVDLGHNMRISTMLAALGLSQLDKVKDNIRRRQEIGRSYNEGLGNITEITVPSLAPGREHVFQLYSILLDSHDHRKLLKEHLDEHDIAAKIYFDPVHLEEVYKEIDTDLPVTLNISDRILSLPIYPTMKDEEVQTVLNTVKSFFKG